MELPVQVGDVSGGTPVVDYFVDPTPALVPLVRVIGVLVVACGVVGLLMVPVEVAYRYQWYARGNGPAPNAFYRANEIVGVMFSIVSGVWLIVGGIGCLRRPAPRGRGVLVTWAWVDLAFAVYGLVVNVWYTIGQGGTGQYTTTMLIYMVGYQIRLAIFGAAAPGCRVGPVASAIGARGVFRGSQADVGFRGSDTRPIRTGSHKNRGSNDESGGGLLNWGI
jgi:hypothetical protein